MSRRAALHLTGLLVVGVLTGGGPLRAQGAPGVASPAEVAALEWVDLLRAGHFDSASVRVDPAVRRELDAARLDSMWTTMERGLGQVERLTPAGARPRGGRTTVDLRARFPRRDVLLQVFVGPRGEILGFTLRPLGR